MEKKQNLPDDLLKNRAAIAKLAASRDAKQLMEMLQGMGGVQQAAQAAAGGDTGALMAMVEGLMHSEQGARIVQNISRQAQQAGLGDV
ncbi:MAG: hypothetical protein IJZ52_05645 [Clostridium sp.]|nr:hypothetical protein [Clostridium sp.]